MKVAIIGVGCVGITSALRIAEADLADLVLVDIVKGKAQGLALDLRSASSIVGHSRSIIGSTEYADIQGAEIVVIAAGRVRKVGESRQALLQSNAKIVTDIAQKITRYCPGSIVIVVTNPLDIMTYLVYKTTGFTANRIIGMGGILDCARFNMLIGDALNIPSYNIQSLIIGPHSDKMTVLDRLSTVNGIAISEFLSQDVIKDKVEEVRNFGAKIVQLLGTGSAYFAPAAAILSLLEAIINDQKRILCVSSYLTGSYGLNDLCIGVPATVGRTGIQEVIELKLTKEEKKAFLNSAKELKDLVKQTGV